MRTFTDLDYTRMKPAGRYVVVEVSQPDTKTSGGILLPEQVKDDHKFSEIVGKIVSMGKFAFCKNINGVIEKEDFVVEDYVLFHPYAGDLHESANRKPGDKTADYRLIHDDSIIGRLFREDE